MGHRTIRGVCRRIGAVPGGSVCAEWWLPDAESGIRAGAGMGTTVSSPGRSGRTLARATALLGVVWGVIALGAACSGGEDSREPAHLFVDDFEVASSEGVTRVWQTARKANDGAPLRFWQRDDKGERVPLSAAIYASALYDAQRGVFQMWSRVFPGLKAGTNLEGTDLHQHMRYGYSESRDGVNFELVSELKGLHSNGDYNIVVTLDPRTANPRHRYKAGYDGAPPGFPNGACLAHSADGIEWTPYHDGLPVTGRAADFTNCLIRDETAGVFRLFTRTDFGSGGGPGEIRGMRMMVNPNVEQAPADWTTVREWKLDREGPDEHRRRQIYTMTDWQYAGVHFGLFSIYEWPNDFSEGRTTDHVRRHERDVINTYLATSRDAVHWDLSTVYAGQPLIERGGDHAWDKDMVFPSSGIITRDQEHWIYYGGANERHGVAEIFQPRRSSAMGLAKLPLDRFAGLQAGDNTGTIVTRPFMLTSAALVLNADARQGEVLVDVLDAEGQPVPDLSGENAATVQNTDDFASRLEWKTPGLGPRTGQKVQLRFRLRNATLYAFQVEKGVRNL